MILVDELGNPCPTSIKYNTLAKCKYCESTKFSRCYLYTCNSCRNFLRKHGKKCSQCKQVKFILEFYKRKGGGLRSMCKKCNSVYCRNQYREKTNCKTRFDEEFGFKTRKCTKCLKRQPNENFCKNKNQPWGLNKHCRSCAKKNYQQWKQKAYSLEV